MTPRLIVFDMSYAKAYDALQLRQNRKAARGMNGIRSLSGCSNRKLLCRHEAGFAGGGPEVLYCRRKSPWLTGGVILL